MRRAAGFTLIELLVAIGVLALMAGMSWRGLDAMVRSQDQARRQSDALLTLQAGLGQWRADLDAIVDMQLTPALDWDGRCLRLTRRSQRTPDDGVLVVAWARRSIDGIGYWLRWQSPPARTRGELLAQWAQAAQWAQNPGDAQRRHEVAVLPLDEWQIYYYRNDAWTHPLSSEGATPGTARQGLPDGIRLVLVLPPGQAVAGRLTRDWVRSALAGGKS